MKEGQSIDDLFKNRLKDYELEAPMHLWDAIAEASLDDTPREKRRGFFWWTLAPSLFGLLIAIYVMQPFGKKQPLDNLGEFPVEIPAKEKIQSQASTVPPIASAQKKAVDLESTVLPERTPSMNSTIKNSNANIPNITSNGPTSTQGEGAASAAFMQEENLLENRVAAKEETSVDQQQAITSLRIDLLAAKPEILPATAPNLDSIRFSSSFKKKKNWSTTIDFMASMDYVMRNLEAKEADFAAYAKKRDESEIFRHGTSFGMRLSTVSDKGFAVRSGLNYSTINEQLNLKIGEEERLIAKIKYAEDGSIIGTDTTLAMVGTYKIVNNRYSELDIPLLVGYEYSGEKVALSFNGGLFINMLSAQKGEFLSPNTDEPVSFSSSDPNSYRAFRNRLGLGFYGSMGVYFQVNENLQFLLEPYVKWRPGSYTVEGYALDQRYLTTGLFVGMRKSVY